MDTKKLSKFLSLILRHKPQTIGITLDKNAWADVDELIRKISQKHTIFTFEILKQIVDTDEKMRYSFNDDFSKIRANQGHSIDVNLEFEAAEPPELLYHGTIAKNLKSIKENGLVKGSRQYVHLSKDTKTAVKVGSRRGNPYVLGIESKKMHEAGFDFYLSENGVWLTDHVPAEYINFSMLIDQ